MKFLVVDDEPFALQDFGEQLGQVVPNGEIYLFSNSREAVYYAGRHSVDVAFLDIELGGINGIALAKMLKDIQPDIHIIFVTGYEQYALEAFSVHATGYLMKPVMEADIRRELTFLYGELVMHEKSVRIQTFGGFSLFVDDVPVKFSRSKTKELLACLVDRRGGTMTTREACSLLWEDGRYSRERKNYFQVILVDLRTTLREAGIEKLLVRQRNSLAINPDYFICDSYRFLDGDPQAVNSYRHNYLPSYSWAEFTVGILEEKHIQ